MVHVFATVRTIDEKQWGAFVAFLKAHPAFAECHEWVGDWRPEDEDVQLDGSFTTAQLRIIADYMDKHKTKRTET